MNETYKLQIEALLDGELDNDQADKVRQTMVCYPEMLEYYSRVKNQKEMLQRWWQEKKQYCH